MSVRIGATFIHSTKELGPPGAGHWGHWEQDTGPAPLDFIAFGGGRRGNNQMPPGGCGGGGAEQQAQGEKLLG